MLTDRQIEKYQQMFKEQNGKDIPKETIEDLYKLAHITVDLYLKKKEEGTLESLEGEINKNPVPSPSRGGSVDTQKTTENTEITD